MVVQVQANCSALSAAIVTINAVMRLRFWTALVWLSLSLRLERGRVLGDAAQASDDDPIDAAEAALLARFRSLQRGGHDDDDVYTAIAPAEPGGTPLPRFVKLKLSDWGFFWSHNW